MIRIASGQGFWGDSIDAPLQQIRGGPIDYLTLDYLAEVTMSILQKQRSRDPESRYARDFIEMLAKAMPELIEKNIRVVANAGGLNPLACRHAVLAVAEKLGVTIRVAAVTGDDASGRLDELIAGGIEFRNMDTDAPLSDVRRKVRSANACFGAFPRADALNRGAQIAITGRCADAALALGPMIHEFGWGAQDRDRIASGIVAGHVVECGAQVTGGNCQMDWTSIPRLASIGYPILEVNQDGSSVVAKHANTGGRVTVASVKEQLIYEIGDPSASITPDCIADFTTLHLERDGADGVRVSGVTGRPATESYKVSVSYPGGFKAADWLSYTWPDAYRNAQAGDSILRERLDLLGLKFDAIRSEFLGAGGCHGIAAAEPSPESAAQLPEVVLRVGARSQDRAAIERFSKEIAPLVLSGPPSVSGLGFGRPPAEEIVAYWPALIPKNAAVPEVTSRFD